MGDLQREYTKPVIEIQPDEDDVQHDPAEASVSVQGVSVWQTLLNEPSAEKFGGIRRQAQQRQRDVESRLEKVFDVEHRVAEAVRGRKSYSDVRRIVAKSNIVTSVDREHANDLRVSYREQGNLEMYTADNMKLRDGNKHHPEIVGALDSFWNVLPKLPNGKINKSIYVWMCRKLYFKLVKNATEGEFQAVVQEDWRNDAVFGNAMNIRMFRQAIFAMADVWCETIDPREYRDFIMNLQRAVEAGPPFKGSLADDDEDAPAQAPGRRSRRPSQLPGLSDMPVAPVGTAIHAARVLDGEKDGEGIDAELLQLLADEEGLLIDCFEAEANATAEMLRALCDHGAALETVTEDTVLLRAGLAREKQLKLFGDVPGETLEERMIDQVNAHETAREKRRTMVLLAAADAEAMQQNAHVEGGNHITRLAARTKIHEDAMKGLHQVFHALREAVFRSTRVFSDARAETAKLETQRLEVKKAVHVDPYDLEHVAYVEHRSAWSQIDFAHQRTVESMFFDDAIKFSHNLESARMLLAKLRSDSLHSAIEGHTIDEEISHFEREREDRIDFGTRRWKVICDYFGRGHANRGEWSAGVLDTIRDEVMRIQSFELGALKHTVESERKLEQKMTEIIRNDKTVSEAHKERSIADAVKSTKERQLQRDARVLALKAEHEQMNEDLSNLQSDHDALVEAQKLMLEQWATAGSIADLMEATVEHVELLEAAKTPSSMAQTVMTRPKTQLTVSCGGTTRLPEKVKTPLDIAIFVDQQEMSSFGFHIERLLSERLRFGLNAYERYQRRKIDGLAFMASHKVAFRLRRVGDLDDYASTDRTALGFLEREIVRQRLEKAAVYKDELRATLAWRDSSLEEAEQLAQAESRALHETRLVVSRIFEMERTFRDKHIAVQSNWTRLSQYKRSLDRAKVRRAERLCFDETAERQLRLPSSNAEERTALLKVRREQQDASEKKRQADVHLRKAELESRKADAAKRERNVKAQEHRRKLLAEQERRQKERLQKEREEKERWHREFMEQEQKRLHDLQEKKAWQDYRQTGASRLEPGGRVRRSSVSKTPNATPPSEPLQVPAMALRRKSVDGTAGPIVRRKSHDASAKPVRRPSVDTRTPAKGAQPAKPTKPVPKPTAKKSKKQHLKLSEYQPMEGMQDKIQQKESSPHASMQMRLKEIAASGLNGSAVEKQHTAFADRRVLYVQESMSNRQIYMHRCKELSVAPDTELLQSLSTEPLLFDLTVLNVSNRKVHAESLIDILMFNPVQRLYLRKADLDNAGTQAICAALAQDGFITHVDVRNNPKIDDVGGSFLLALAKSNPRIAKLQSDGTSVSPDTLKDITTACTSNQDGRDLGRAEFQFIRDTFNEMDTDRSGVVTLAELRDFAAKEAKRLSVSSSVSSPHSLTRQASTMDRMQAELHRRVEAVRSHLCSMASKEGTGDFNLADLICFIFPQWSVQEADRIVERFTTEDDSGPSLTEMQEFVDSFGSNGNLTLQQLANGLGESPEALRTVFGEYDIDNDGRLSLDEFMRFMSA
jgi:Ca2+-binding EF-hand superfamily protein